MYFLFFFFFQAEDGIRDGHVTGVQTCALPILALGALKALEEANISVPKDVKVIGCDDIEACRYSNPKLATVKQDKDKIGELAAKMLHRLIDGNKEVNSMLVEPELIIRESAMFEQAPNV